MNAYKFESEHEQEVFEYLDELRESGSTNMFGAAPYLIDEFSIDKRQARRFVQKWMTTFSDRFPGENH